MTATSRHLRVPRVLRGESLLSGALEKSATSFLLHLLHDPQEVAAPDLRDLFLGVAALHEFQRHVEGLGRITPSVDATATIEVGADADVVDPDQLHGVVDVVDEISDRCAPRRGVQAVDSREPAVEVHAPIRRE